MDRLPIELLHLIVESLSTSSRAALARTCRRYYGILQPHVYANVFLNHSCAKASFFKSVLQRPHLALAVRSLHLDSWETHNVEIRSEEVTTRLGDAWGVDLFRKLVSDDPRFKDDAEEWFSGLDSFNEDAFVALSMPRFTNLKRLGIEYPYGCDFFNRLMMTTKYESASAFGSDAAARVADMFPCLEELHIAWYDTENAISAHMAVPFFSITTLRKVSGNSVAGGSSDDANTSPPAEGKTRFSGVTEIDLANSHAGDAGLSVWLNLCHGLKSFRYAHGGATVSWDDFAPAAFATTLAPHRHTLERLWIEVDEGIDLDNVEGRLGSAFAEYSALKILCITLAILLENPDGNNSATTQLADAVPRSLEVLVLVDSNDDWIVSQVEHLLRVNRCPRLKLLVLEWYGAPEWKEKLHTVRELCEEAGVQLRFRSGKYMAEVWPWYSIPGVEMEPMDWNVDGEEEAVVL
ncbi:hypothetical protein BJX64DRAFT_203769 [Aspergillus heterothallicus]